MKDKAISQAPLRIVEDQTLVGKVGQAKRWQPILAQTMVFNRAAKLNEDLVRKNKSVIPAGTTLFVTTDKKVEYHCLPRDGFMSNQILCFDDKDGDGKLEHESNGGTPLNGVYMYASGFSDRGVVLTPAAASSIPYMEGHKQQVGIQWVGSNLNIATLSLAVSAGKNWTPVSNSTVAIKLDANGEGVGELMGAKIEVRQLDKNLLQYKIVTPIPERPFGLHMRVTYR